MTESAFVPHAPSSSVKVAVPRDVVDVYDQLAGRMGLSRDDCIELSLRATADGPTSAAAAAWASYTGGATQTPADVVDQIESAGIRETVRGFRLATSIPLRHPAAFTDEPPATAWLKIRGFWRMRPAGTSVIVGLRLGIAIAVFKVAGWEIDPDTGRHYAVGGQAITASGRLLDAETGTDAGEATSSDLTILRAVTAAPIVLPRGSAQPVIKLSRE